MDKLKSIVTGHEEKETTSIMDDMNESCTLSKKSRLIGFCVCAGIGILISFLSMFAILKPVTFAIVYSLGNLISLSSTAFLVGPVKQLKNMFAEKRIIATIVYLCALLLTLVVAIVGGKKYIPIIILLIVVQFLALVWYTASYIPFARSMITSCLGSCFK